VLGSTFGTALGIRPGTGLDEELEIELCIVLDINLGSRLGTVHVSASGTELVVRLRTEL
jgi:hypothetical protein